MATSYKYVGPKEFLQAIGSSPTRRQIRSISDVTSWKAENGQKHNKVNELVVTFVITADGALWLADRHSEHVACAMGQPVLSAGEMTFDWADGEPVVSAVTNQSTGYCPEPESWVCVAEVLMNIGLAHPNDFTTSYTFRLCDTCGSINIVKDDWFVCALCNAPLSPDWNFDRDED